METELAQRAAAGRLRSTVITAGDFFGAGSGSWFDAVVAKSIAKGTIGYPGDPTRVHAVSYGDSKPLADNKTQSGRKDNRRIEILVYQQKVATASQ